MAPLRLRWRSAILEAEAGLSWHGRLLGCVLVEHATNTSAVLDPAPSATTLASEMGASVTSVHEGRRELEAGDWLKVTRRSGRPSRMRLVLPEPLRETQGSDGVTSARTYAPTSARTSAPHAPEQGEPGEPGEPGAYARVRACAREADGPLVPHANAQALVAWYVDRVRELGAEPPKRAVGQVARQVGELTGEGFDEEVIRAALGLMVERRLHPAVLPSLMLEAQAGPPARRANNPTDDLWEELRRRRD
jgi:hypothetical protein